ncbi:YceI family protein [Myroides sp. LJL115]
MKKTLLALLFVGALMASCGDKKQDNTGENTTEVESVQQKNLNYTLSWTAFKTPEKVGVTGSFTDIKLSGLNQKGTTIEQELQGATFVVATSSVTTKDAARDQTLVASFFSQMTGNISGFFGEFTQDKVLIHLTMNGKTIEKEFDYTTIENGIHIKGSIDIISDFAAQGAFNSLHEACKALHEGKTWSDVDISVDITK